MQIIRRSSNRCESESIHAHFTSRKFYRVTTSFRYRQRVIFKNRVKTCVKIHSRRWSSHGSLRLGEKCARSSAAAVFVDWIQATRSKHLKVMYFVSTRERIDSTCVILYGQTDRKPGRFLSALL